MKTTNVWYATDTETGKTIYVVAYYTNGQYQQPMTAYARKANGGSTWIGSFSYMRKHRTESGARAFARRNYGYSKMEKAYNLPDRYL